MDGALVSNVAGNDTRVADTGRYHHVMVLEDNTLEAADPDEPGELAVAYERWIEWFADEDLAPVGTAVAVPDQHFDVEVMEQPVRIQWLALLPVAQPILVLPRFQIPGRDETVTQDCLGVYKDVIHGGLPDVRLLGLLEAPHPQS
jgi:hypothetical protein